MQVRKVLLSLGEKHTMALMLGTLIPSQLSGKTLC